MMLRGDRELVRALNLLGRGLPNSVIDRNAVEAMDPMLQDAKARARLHRQPGRRPRGGHVDEGIAVRRSLSSTRRTRRFLMGGINRALRLLHLLEFGTRPHFQPRRFGGVFHPGARAFPVMRPALETHGDQIPERFGRGIWRSLSAMIAAIPKTARR